MRRARASSTAVLIVRALALVCGERRFTSLVPPDLAQANESMLAVTPGARSFRRALRIASVRALLRAAERHLLPGIGLHYLLRKRRLEELVRASLEEGCRSVVVLGAGLDTLALRLHRAYPEVSFVEIDHPATQASKRRGLGACGEIGSNLTLLADDLEAGSLARLLSSRRAEDDGRPMVTVAEGLLMYLPPRTVREIFVALAARRRTAAIGPADRIAFTFMATTGSDAPRFPGANHLVDAWLRWRSEPFRWGCDSGELAGWLSNLGWNVVESEGSADLRRRYLCGSELAGEPLAAGERVVLAAARGSLPGT